MDRCDRLLRILMTTDYFHPHIGGVERAVFEVSLRLARRGHQVTILTFNTPVSHSTESFDGLTVIRAKALDLTDKMGLQAAVSLEFIPQALSLISKVRPEIINCQTLFFTSTLLTIILRRAFPSRLITTLHLGSIDLLKGSTAILARLYQGTIGRLILRGSDRLIAVSRAVAEHAVRLGAHSRVVRVIPNGVDTGLFRPTGAHRSDAPTIVFVGRMIANKGPQFVIEAAEGILKIHPDTKFVMVGDGPMKPSLEKEVSRRGISRSFEFAGKVPDVLPFLQQGDVFVRPSLSEGLPLTILEAMACGLCVVASDIPGTAEVVQHGGTGLLFRPGDTIGLAKCLLEVLGEPRRAVGMGSKARAFTEKYYSWDKITDMTEELFLETLES